MLKCFEFLESVFWFLTLKTFRKFSLFSVLFHVKSRVLSYLKKTSVCHFV